MLTITMAARTEQLAGCLANRLAASPLPPFAAEEVIVPCAAMRRYLSLALARQGGICANLHFSYLGSWFWEQIRKIMPVAPDSPYARNRLVWQIFPILGETAFISAHLRLERWLAGNDQTGRFELSLLLATLFEQYLTYRPDWLKAWFDGKTAVKGCPADEAWQAALWKKIEEKTGSDGVHPAHRFFAALQENPSAAKTLPQRLSVFCLPAIPPQYLGMLEAISQWVEVNLYVLNPCREYWFDIVPEKKLAALQQAGKAAYHETGNALLAAWGKQTQSCLSQLSALNTDYDFLEPETPPAPSLLGCLQKAVLALEEPVLAALPQKDRSIEIHICHSLMREVEVLHDQLLSLFSGKNPPSPSDVVIITPDVKQVAPLMEAVFDDAASGRRIPYRITGRPASLTNPVAKALLDVLSLAASRLTAAAVYDLLLQPLVARQFGLETALEQVHAWLEEAGVCWGFDGEQKTAFGLPQDNSRSFYDGFYRLFLAYALPPDTAAPFGSRLPAGNPEGSAAAQLGCLWRLLGQLKELAQKLDSPRPGHDWRKIVLAAMDHFICSEAAEPEDDLAVRETIGQLFDCMETAGSTPIEAAVMRQALSAALDEPAHGSIPSGAVTLAPMAGLRNLPYRFVFIVGMSDGAFPAERRPPGFDLMAHDRRTGDMQRKEDDRNLFLDWLLSAKERLYISYTGRNARDNASLPPSIVVSELLDCLARAVKRGCPQTDRCQAEKAVEAHLVIVHPLQAFSARYFEAGGDERIKSHHTGFCRALLARRTQTANRQSQAEKAFLAAAGQETEQKTSRQATGALFFGQALARPDASWQQVTLADLAYFFENPSRFLLSSRLGLSFPTEQEALPESEPFTANGLDTFRFASRLLPLLLSDCEKEKIMAAAQAGNEFPPGRMGEITMETELEKLSGFAGPLKENLAAPVLPPLSGKLAFTLQEEIWTLQGELADVRKNGLIRYRYIKADGESGIRFRLSAWIDHLFLNALAPENVTCRTTCHFAGSRLSFSPCPPAAAKQHLEKLLSLYRKGLTEPLHFFPQTALAFVEKNESLAEARKKWESNYHNAKSEGDNPFYRLALRGQDTVLNTAFEECARQVMSPLNEMTEKP
ncbi:MAG: exodeoxyribonuclease V subunit gamma [Alistipes senegalensis]|nr:exodeoxyribonuclease V subunit gamma [Oxalobacter formigenes]MCM1281551.1 exodeoxyribonuclease V subunit gamma [Alistipes senegalensis]